MNPSTQKRGGWFSTIQAVLWGFLGVRRYDDYQNDVKRLNPLHLMLVGVVMTFLFAAGLMLLVQWIV